MLRPPALRAALTLCCVAAGRAAAADPAGDEFFETKVRPVLVQRCAGCHSAGKAKGGLRLDGRDALLAGGDSGPAVVPGKPGESRLVAAVSYKDVDLQMPPKGKLPAAAVADLTRWVEMGAPWPGGAGPAAAAREFDLHQRKRDHWAWQPVRPQPVPAVRDGGWVRDPADAFVLAKLEAKGLTPAPPADRAVWLRRVTFDLTGLPPTPADVEAFLADGDCGKVVDRLLASPHFGERWARHWLDLVRYAESRGHEFDYTIPNAHQYRDYVVRALNADVPYNQFVTEHIAGDLLPEPRRHPRDGFNESVLGTGFWLLGEEVHSPVDVRQDQADRFDNRIDVMTKAFLGLTVSCARCHDHKFDAVSARDYYSLYGFLSSCSPRLVRFDTLHRERRAAAELAALRAKARAAVRPSASPAEAPVALPDGARVVIDYGALRAGEWLPDGAAFGTGPVRPGDVVFTGSEARLVRRAAAAYDRAWDGITVAAGTEVEPGALGKLPPRAGRTVRTPTARLTGGDVRYLVRGRGAAYAAVASHALIDGPLHGKIVTRLDGGAGGEFRWVRHDLTRYRGLDAHFEFTAEAGSDFAVAMVVESEQAPAQPGGTADVPLADPALAPLLAERDRVAAGVAAESRLAPALMDGTGVDERVFIRGSPKAEGEPARRRFLEALAGPDPLRAAGSGRLELARLVTDPAANPFVARVFVNRVWHHLFGRGIVASTDNFGVLGDRPTHPELLDHLADRFVRDGWSLKRLVRALALSSAYRMSSRVEAAADRADPGNELLHRARLRRLDGESVRDAMLLISGRLDPKLYGPAVPIHLTAFIDGKGRPKGGPLDGDGRRSLYLAVRRNFLSPMLLAFDTPTPFSTVGRRTVSNVPAQALILMNDPFVHQQAEAWGRRVAAAEGPAAGRVRGMYLQAFARPPADGQLRDCLDYLDRHRAGVAAWAGLAHALVNVKEFVFVE